MAKAINKEKNTPTLQLDDKEYNIEDLADEQRMLVAHISDLNRKIDSASFNLQQLQFGRQAVIDSLKHELNKEEVKEK
tara:strand:+ start:99 stop:332 length:234 start_codon:yes stop_codon:yes gene_type:complete